ncbi:MAG TPA: tonB-system energizer ExbB [Xanthobacteraceae bacterium]|nr:tonB-system energizer ExbB [Xanthobacteraceae bacterium]
MPFEKSRLLRRRNRTTACVLSFLLLTANGLRSAYAQTTDAATAAAVPTVTAELPRDLSPWGMFVSADLLVKGVLICLVLASIATWTVWLAKTFELVAAKRAARRALVALAQARSIPDAADELGRSKTIAGKMVQAAVAELRLSDDTMEREGIKERIASRLERIEAQGGRRMMRGTGILATIGAIAPFVGLFGTVWGIMNSFIGISKSQTTNLAVVAPGIAEALLATAFGLAAAIPAVVIYNMFSRQIAGYRALLGDASAEVLRIVGRDLDRSASPRTRAHLSAAE